MTRRNSYCDITRLIATLLFYFFKPTAVKNKKSISVFFGLSSRVRNFYDYCKVSLRIGQPTKDNMFWRFVLRLVAKKKKDAKRRPFLVVEMRGIEPLSELPSIKLSTSVFSLLRFPRV